MKRVYAILTIIIIIPICLSTSCIGQPRKEIHLLDEKSIDLIVEDDDAESSVTKIEPHEIEMLELAMSYSEASPIIDDNFSFSATIPSDCIKEIVNYLSARGYTVAGAYDSLKFIENHHQFEDFLLQALDGNAAEAIYYDIDSEGGFYRLNFISNDRSLSVIATQLTWDDENNPVSYIAYSYETKDWHYTEKGYLICETNYDVHAYDFRRIKPLGLLEQELYINYIKPIGYQGNNLFLTEWDKSNMTQIDFNDLYEFIYRMDKGYSLDVFFYYDYISDGIATNDFEELMLRYFDLSAEDLQAVALYYKELDTYFWASLPFDRKYILFPAPFPEVVDSWQNNDRTITMVVDAIDDYAGNDRVFTHEVTIQIEEDGSFKYLSNYIRTEDKNNVPSYYARRNVLEE